MAVNDLITVGATPLVVQAYWAAGGSDWFGNAERSLALVEGWKRACEICGVAWGGGETPALAGIVEAGRIDLAASCTGIVNPKQRLSVGDALGDGDAIVLLASSGIHANGVSLARKVAERLPQGWLTPIDDQGTRYGDALLAPTTLYSPVTEALWQAGITPHYSANITGHGWRKLLRHPKALTYRITRCRRCRRCSPSSPNTPATMRRRPTRRSTWAPASRCSSPQATRNAASTSRAPRHRRLGRRPRRSRPQATADRAARAALRRRRAESALTRHADYNPPRRAFPHGSTPNRVRWGTKQPLALQPVPG